MLSLGWFILKEFEYINYMSRNGSFHTYFKNLAIQTGLITSTLILSTIMDHRNLLVVIVCTGLLVTQWNILHSLVCGVIQSILIGNHDWSNYMSSYKNYGTIPHLESHPFVFCITHVCNSLIVSNLYLILICDLFHLRELNYMIIKNYPTNKAWMGCVHL